MKKFLAFVIGLSSISSVEALPVFNPAQPEFLRYSNFCCGVDYLSLGYRCNLMLDRDLRVKNAFNIVEDGRKLNDLSLATNAAQMTINICERVDLYGWVGAGHADFNANVSFIDITNQGIAPSGLLNLRGSTRDNFSWGAGARAILWTCGRNVFGVDVQYANFNSPLNSLTADGTPVSGLWSKAGEPLRSTDFHFTHQEYQVALAFSHRICMFVPYVAVKYFFINSKFDGPLFSTQANASVFPYNSQIKVRTHGNTGIAFGASYVYAARAFITAEASFLNEIALSVLAEINY